MYSSLSSLWGCFKRLRLSDLRLCNMDAFVLCFDRNWLELLSFALKHMRRNIYWRMRVHELVRVVLERLEVELHRLLHSTHLFVLQRRLFELSEYFVVTVLVVHVQDVARPKTLVFGAWLSKLLVI